MICFCINAANLLSGTFPVFVQPEHAMAGAPIYLSHQQQATSPQGLPQIACSPVNRPTCMSPAANLIAPNDMCKVPITIGQPIPSLPHQFFQQAPPTGYEPTSAGPIGPMNVSSSVFQFPATVQLTSAGTVNQPPHGIEMFAAPPTHSVAMTQSYMP